MFTIIFIKSNTQQLFRQIFADFRLALITLFYIENERKTSKGIPNICFSNICKIML